MTPLVGDNYFSTIWFGRQKADRVVTAAAE